MDFLDHGKEIRERITLFVGYFLIALGVVMSCIILVYGAYGFNFNSKGNIIQNGLVFFSSQPSPASIFINGKYNGQNTNARLILPSGIDQIELTRPGYRNWYRTITVDGGQVEHFDYPVLFPTHLVSKKFKTYSSAPGLVTQSPDRQWLLVEKPGDMTDFDLYNLKTPAKPVVTTLTLSSNLLTKATTSESWQFVDWSDDNQHVLLKHLYDGKTEFILVNISDPTQSVNLTTSLSLSATDEVTLNNDKYNNYYIYDSSNGSLGTAILNTPGVSQLLQQVISFKSYGNNTVLYTTNLGASSGKVAVKMMTGNQDYYLRSLPTSTTYVLNLTSYGGSLYVAIGGSSSGRVYIYQDPVSQLTSQPSQVLVPIWVLHVPSPNYLSFSDNAQFIMTEDNNEYSVYDIQNNLGYLYMDAKTPLDSPQPNATWMDGDRLTYISNGKLVVQDYDNRNQQTLTSASPLYLPAFSNNYGYVFTVAPNESAPGQYDLLQTALLAPNDL